MNENYKELVEKFNFDEKIFKYSKDYWIVYFLKSERLGNLR